MMTIILERGKGRMNTEKEELKKRARFQDGETTLHASRFYAKTLTSWGPKARLPQAISFSPGTTTRLYVEGLRDVGFPTQARNVNCTYYYSTSQNGRLFFGR